MTGSAFVGPHRATVRDVAKRAGVSAATVSRAFKRPDLVAPRTRTRIQSAADDLGYVAPATGPHPTERTGNLGLIVPDIANPLFAPLIKAMQSEARRLGYALMIADSDEQAASEHDAALIFAAQTDGLFLASSRLGDDHIRALNERTPVVSIGRVVKDIASVSTPADLGLDQAVEHLKALGHETIAYLGGSTPAYVAEQRAAVVRAASARHRMECMEFGPFATSVEAGVRAADLVMASRATSVIAYSDQIAFGLVRRLAARGASVPRDVSVVGVDDSWIARTSLPALTSVSIPVVRGGVMAVDLMVRVLANDEIGVTETPQGELIVRESTAPPSQV